MRMQLVQRLLINKCVKHYRKYARAYLASELHMLKSFNQLKIKTLLMKEFDVKLVSTIAKKTSKLHDSKLPKLQYGHNKRKDYLYQLHLLEWTEKVCRANKWFTRDEWIAHKVPMNKLVSDLAKSTKDYSDILIYYFKNPAMIQVKKEWRA